MCQFAAGPEFDTATAAFLQSLNKVDVLTLLQQVLAFQALTCQWPSALALTILRCMAAQYPKMIADPALGTYKLCCNNNVEAFQTTFSIQSHQKSAPLAS